MKAISNIRSIAPFSKLGTAKSLAIIIPVLIAGTTYGGFNQYSIGVKFGTDATGNGGGVPMGAADIAGVPAVSQANWNNAPAVSGALGGGLLLNNSGADSGAGVIWVSPTGVWASGPNNMFSSVTDSNLMKGYLDNGGTATVTFTNLPSQLTSSGYDVYVYALYDTPGRGGTYAIVDGTNTATILKPAIGLNADATPTNYVQAPGGTATTGNYLLFRGLTNANIQVQAVATNTGTPRAIICAVQLVASPEVGDAGAATGLKLSTNSQTGQLVATWTNGASSTGALLVMRRGLPVTALPVDGVAYSGNLTFGSGDNLGNDEAGAPNFAVFNGATAGITSTQTVVGLVPGATYFGAVFSTTGSSDYSLAFPTTATGVPRGSPTNVVMMLPSPPLVAGSARHFSVLAQYDNGVGGDITASATVTSLGSTNGGSVTILAPGRLGALAAGTVLLKATNSTINVTQAVNIVGMSMQYEFSFNEPSGSLAVTDSLSGAVGTISNTPSSGVDGSGNLVLDGSAGYVLLPPNILTNYGALTVELWATESALGTWARFWDFGTGPTVNMFQTPTATASGLFRTAFTVAGGGNETVVNYLNTADTGVQHQYVFTLNGATLTGSEYIDGVLVGVNTPSGNSAGFGLTPEDEGPTTQDYLGKSQYAADPYYNGSMAEFRIYNGPLNPYQIALDATTGPDSIVINPGTCTNLTVTASSPLIQFGFEQANVIGQFSGIANPVNLTTSGQITYISGNTNIFTVNNLGNVSGIGPGTTTLTVVGFGQTNSTSITINLLPPGLTHRWPFNSDFHDASNVGNPAFDAIPHNTVTLDGFGNAMLDGSGAANTTTGSYIELPGNILLGYGSTTLECWYTDMCGDGTTVNGGVNRNWARIFDFGSGAGNNLWITPFVGGQVDTMRAAININNAGEFTLNCVRPLTNVEHHVVFVENTTNLTAYLYVDGDLVAQNRDFRARPRDMGLNPQDWLGRSQYGDPLFAGLIDEFRIYNGTIDAVQVGVDYVAGPNSPNPSPGSLTSTKVVLTTNMLAGNMQNAKVLATFASYANVPVTSAATNWTSSDITVARVDKYGRISASGPGSADISATFRGSTSAATVMVSAKPAPTLLHRYSFNAGDATDSVAGANGAVNGTAGTDYTFANGQFTILTANGNIALPGHLFDDPTNNEVTLEFWGSTASTSGSGQRMVDFGNSAAGRAVFSIVTAGNGSAYMSLRQSPVDVYGTPALDYPFGRPAFGTTNHYAFVVSDVNQKADLYLNGELYFSFPYNTQPDQFQGGSIQFKSMLYHQTTNQTEGWIGRAVGGSGSGGGWRGMLDEFRIWNGAFNKVQAKASYLAGLNNPTTDPGALQSLKVAMSDNVMIIGTFQRATVSAVFANSTSNFDITGLPVVNWSSDNSAAVAVVNGGDSKLQAVGLGTAHVVAAYGGLSVTNTVSVVAKPPSVPTHDYIFTGGNANDAVGQANGKLFGTATFSGGRLVLDGSVNPPSFVRLPNDLISGYDLATFEMFYNSSAGSSDTQQRLWDFGDDINLNGGITGAGYIYEAAGRHATGLPGNFNGVQEISAIAPSLGNRSALNTNVTYVAATVDSINGILSIYTNGVLAASSTNQIVDLARVTDNQSFLGRSQWNDPTYVGTMTEFRLSYGLMTPAQIAASYAAGPRSGQLTITLGPLAGQVTISWPETVTGSLQMNSSLNPLTWSPAGPPSLVNGYNQVVVNTTGASFFRLSR